MKLIAKFVALLFSALVLISAGALLSLESWLPSAVTKFSPDYLSGSQIQIREVKLAWRRADIELIGVELLKGGKTQASISKLSLDLESEDLVANIMDQQLWINSIKVGGADFVLEEKPGSWGLKGLDLGPAATQESSQNTENVSKPWRVVLNNIEFARINAKVRGESLSSNVALHEFKLDHFDTLSKTVSSQLALSLALDSTNLTINQQSLSLAGQVSFEINLMADGLLLQPNLSGSFKANDINLITGQYDDQLALLAIKEIDAPQFHSAFLNKANSQLKSLAINGISLLSNTPQEQQIDSIKLANLEHHMNGIALEAGSGLIAQGIYITGLNSQLTFSQDYQLAVLTEIEKTLAPFIDAKEQEQSKSNKEAEKNLEATNKLRVTLEDVQLNDSHFKIDDTNYSPTVSLPLEIKKLAIDQFDSENKEGLSRWVLDATLDKQGQIKSEGMLKPLASDLAMQAKLTLEHVNLVSLSPYFEKQTGYFIHTGQLSLDSQSQLDGKQLKSKNQINLRSIELERVAANKADQVDQNISMPLDSALGLLRDDNGDIKLDLPVDGDISSPAFGSGDILKQVSSRALKEASVAYLKYAFQPYGTLITVGSWLNEQAQKIRLDSLAFDHGQSELSQEQKDYLRKLGQLLQKKDKLRVRACPVISAQEETWIAQQNVQSQESQAFKQAEQSSTAKIKPDLEIKNAQQLANVRLEALKSYMTQQFAIGPDRLISCKVQNDNKNSQSYIHLEI
ncbi:DUF748 domain-containing protein [uncultured Pseudoteredinibacter sp.]|uniref:DUF748 domain-containing protein n=1 Tax=uncultured Pseudoteredinibacter sp. TaxID=1641701 RepID=UPI002614B909|nr:DUF748 domain-containing protein [uncultured Pseudoteredinibacter sp.]